MKAIVIYGANDLRVAEVPDPEPGRTEVRIAVEWGGICGSDLAYWKHGASGTAILREPLIVGHEYAGKIDKLGADVKGLEIGQPVTVNPATLVGEHEVPPHLRGRDNLWPEVRYHGSAAFTPHEQGGFSTFRLARAEQVRPLPEGISTRQGALAEPLGVAIHAVRRAGDLTGQTVLVNGTGPIGCLVIAAARHAGAAEIWAADIQATSLELARKMGAAHLVNRAEGQDLPVDVDVAFEASGVSRAIGDVLSAVVRGGRLVQVGNLPAGDVPVSLGQLVTREIEYRGSYRFIDEISDAIKAMSDGLDVEPIITHEFMLEQAQRAFETAADRSTGSSKVLVKIG